MRRTARRLPSLARASLSSVLPAHSTSTSTSTRRGLSKLTSRQSRIKRPPASPQRQQGVDSGERDPAATIELVEPFWTKHLNTNKHVPDDRSVNPGHTIFTSPGATKAAVLDMMGLLEMPSDRGDAAVIFATPRHASWLTDPGFMAGLVQKLSRQRPGADKSTHVLAAVVDGLCPEPPGRQMQEGVSIQFGSLDRLLPGLWHEASDETPAETTEGRYAEPGSESSHVSVVLRKSSYHRETYTINLPLANTLFHNGRRTTLLASEWLTDTSGDQCMKLLRMIEKRTQKIDLPVSPSEGHHNIHMHCPLVPITYPRKIVEGLGNILAKVEIEGQPSPASKELQINIPLLIQQRRTQSSHESQPARVGVWALVIPERLIFVDKFQQQTPVGLSGKTSSRYKNTVPADRLGTAIERLAFEMTHAGDRTAWQRSNVMGEILLQGGRLHQILSGGGEWGAKSSLLSLDPQTSCGAQSEDDELDRFQRSFHGEDAADGAIARPGDFVQFFVEGDSEVSLEARGPMKLMQTTTASLPRAAFGVGEFSKEDQAPERVDASIQSQRELIRLAPNHFGAFSAEGLYLDMTSDYAKETTTTKVNTPGTMIHHVPSIAVKRVDPSLPSKSQGGFDDTNQ